MPSNNQILIQRQGLDYHSAVSPPAAPGHVHAKQIYLLLHFLSSELKTILAEC